MRNVSENFCKLANENGFDFDNHSNLSKASTIHEKYRFKEVNFILNFFGKIIKSI